MTKQEDYEGYKWVKVKRYVDDPTLPTEVRYGLLEEHHIQETTFLINEIRKLAKEIDDIKEKDQNGNVS